MLLIRSSWGRAGGKLRSNGEGDLWTTYLLRTDLLRTERENHVPVHCSIIPRLSNGDDFVSCSLYSLLEIVITFCQQRRVYRTRTLIEKHPWTSFRMAKGDFDLTPESAKQENSQHFSEPYKALGHSPGESSGWCLLLQLKRQPILRPCPVVINIVINYEDLKAWLRLPRKLL